MSETDYVIRGLEYTKEGLFDTKEIYFLIKDWLTKNGYDLFEKQYDVKDNTSKIKLIAEKEIDEYVKFVIELTVKINILEEVLVKQKKNKKLQKGSLNIEFEAYLEKDYEELWEERPIMKFLRGFYDHYILISKFNALEKDLKKDVDILLKEIKDFLKD